MAISFSLDLTSLSVVIVCTMSDGSVCGPSGVRLLFVLERALANAFGASMYRPMVVRKLPGSALLVVVIYGWVFEVTLCAAK